MILFFQDWYEKISTMNTKKAQFHARMNTKIVIRRKNEYKAKFYFSCDPYAMACALDSSAALDVEAKYCSVELHGQATRGQMVVDWDSRMGNPPNVNVVKKVDADVVMRFFEHMLL